MKGLQPGNFRHFDVENYQIEMCSTGQTHRVGGGRGGGNFEPAVGQFGLIQETHMFVVVYYQDSLSGHFPSGDMGA